MNNNLYIDEFDGGKPKYSALDATLNITLTHAGVAGTDPDITFGLFDAYGFLGIASADPNAEITCDEVPYAGLLEYLKGNAIAVSGMKVIAQNTASTAALSRVIEVAERTIGGSASSTSVNLAKLEYGSQFNEKVRELPDFRLSMDGKVGMKYRLKAGESVTIVLFVKFRTSPAAQLAVGTPVETTDSGYIHGNPVLKMLEDK
jgi:hypothetical protein